MSVIIHLSTDHLSIIDGQMHLEVRFEKTERQVLKI